MTFTTDIFPKFFSVYDKRIDINKDSNDEGTLERWVQGMGNELDTNIVPMIDNLVKNIYNPDQCLVQFVVYLESMYGNTVFINSNPALRRAAYLRNLVRYHKARGTLRCIVAMIQALDYTATLTVANNAGTFDSSTFDNPSRPTLDSWAKCCKHFTVVLTANGTVPAVTQSLLDAVASILSYNTDSYLDSFSIFGSSTTYTITQPDSSNGYRYKIN